MRKLSPARTGERENTMPITDNEFQKKEARVRQINDDCAKGKRIDKIIALEAIKLCEILSDELEEMLDKMDAAPSTIN